MSKLEKKNRDELNKALKKLKDAYKISKDMGLDNGHHIFGMMAELQCGLDLPNARYPDPRNPGWDVMASYMGKDDTMVSVKGVTNSKLPQVTGEYDFVYLMFECTGETYFVPRESYDIIKKNSMEMHIKVEQLGAYKIEDAMNKHKQFITNATKKLSEWKKQLKELEDV